MTKLPADLPENWTQGQTVSPNGTEVGLTEQHGYNYLMKQVNATQKEVNGIQDALPDVAQQTTVEEINQKIGTEGDADTQPTVFGRLAQVKNALGEKLQEKLQEVLTKVTGIDEKIGTSEDTVGNNKAGSVMGKLNTIYNLLMGGLVVYDEPGTYEWTVPAGITRVKVTASAAGGGAAGNVVRAATVASERTTVIGGGGGGAGSCIVEKEYEVVPESKLSIKVGSKGIGGKGINAGTALGTKGNNGTDGEATVVGSLVTLPGGHGGNAGISADIQGAVAAAGGLKGGEGATDGTKGYLYFYQNGSWRNNDGGTGSGGSTTLKTVGNGGKCPWKSAGLGEYDKLVNDGTDGMNGYVSISWGV